MRASEGLYCLACEQLLDEGRGGAYGWTVFWRVARVDDPGSVVEVLVLDELGEPELGCSFEDRVADCLIPFGILGIVEMIPDVLGHPRVDDRIVGPLCYIFHPVIVSKYNVRT